MIDSKSVFVPINVHAMVNTGIVGDVNFRRWTMDYFNLQKFSNPECKPFNGSENPKKGIYLMWTLPDALRHGSQDEKGRIEFPIVPNRWLVVRLCGSYEKRAAKSWVVESDHYPTDSKVSSAQYFDPKSKKPASIGRVISVTNSSAWSEPGPSNIDLRAIAPSNLLFSMYQSHNENVFSMHDDLDKLTLEKDSLSYFVAGWYSEQGNDIICKKGLNGKLANEILNELKWNISQSESCVQRSIYHGD